MATFDEHFDKPDRRPLITTAAVRWVCCTVVVLAVIALVAAFAWHRPDDAVRAVAALWQGFTTVFGIAVMLVVVVFFLASIH
jgi:hypothetical protein